MKRALWSSLIKKYGERGLKINPEKEYLLFIIFCIMLASIFILAAWSKYAENTLSARVEAAMFYSIALIPISFILGAIYYNAYPSGAEFLIVYDNYILVSALGRTEGAGMMKMNRKKYWIDVIARDAEVSNLQKDLVYTIVFNKPFKGVNYIRLTPSMYVNEDELKKLIGILKPRRVLLDGLYYPHIYALFKFFFGQKYSGLAESLLRDFSEEIKKYGLYKVSAIMNALRALCLSRQEENAVLLTKAIINGTAFKFLNLVNSELYLKWFCDIINRGERRFIGKLLDKLDFIIVIFPLSFGLFAIILIYLAVFFGVHFSSEIFYILGVIAACGISHVFFHSHSSPWSRGGLRMNYRGMILAHILGSLIMVPLYFITVLISEIVAAFAWLLAVVIVVNDILMIFSDLVEYGYFLYKVGLRQAEVLLKAIMENE